MVIRVFVQNEAGSRRKNYHDEKAFAYRYSTIVSHPYPFPYGFVIGTDAGDGCNVDCFIVTNRILRTGQVVECEPIALMEQFEDGLSDHNVLARLSDEPVGVISNVEAILTEHVLSVFQHVEGKQMSVGRFFDAQEAEAHITSCLEPVGYGLPVTTPLD